MAGPKAFDVQIGSQDGVAVVTVSGEVDIAEAVRLGQTLQKAGGPLVVDLRPCAFMGSEGLSALLIARRHSIQRKRRLVLLLAVGGPVARLFEVTGMRDVFTVVDDDLAAAVTAAAAPDRRQGSDRRTTRPADR